MSVCRVAARPSLAATLVVALACGAAAQQPAAQVNVQKLGPQVGDRILDFTLQDQHGATRTLASLMGPKGLVLLFYRSADWCPYCKAQLVEQQAAYESVRRSGYGLAGVSYDSVATLAEFSARRGITYPLLSDPGSKTIRAYGILNTTVPESNATFGIPFPGTFIVNPQGVVTARYFEDAYQERDSLSSIMVKLGNDLDVPADVVQSPQAKITSFSTNRDVSIGTHFAVVVDIAPAPNVHVYSPEVTEYKPVKLTIEPQPWLAVGETAFPPSEDFYFAPLDEHVPVYEKPFRIVQDLNIDRTPAALDALKERTNVTVRGTLEYQACDDKVCFNPQTVPLTWTLELLPLDRIRATQGR
jgi:peroxiredoxin